MKNYLQYIKEHDFIHRELYLEGVKVRWYNKGKLEREEKIENENDIKVGDFVVTKTLYYRRTRTNFIDSPIMDGAYNYTKNPQKVIEIQEYDGNLMMKLGFAYPWYFCDEWEVYEKKHESVDIDPYGEEDWDDTDPVEKYWDIIKNMNFFYKNFENGIIRFKIKENDDHTFYIEDYSGRLNIGTRGTNFIVSTTLSKYEINKENLLQRIKLLEKNILHNFFNKEKINEKLGISDAVHDSARIIYHNYNIEKYKNMDRTNLKKEIEIDTSKLKDPFNKMKISLRFIHKENKNLKGGIDRIGPNEFNLYIYSQCKNVSRTLAHELSHIHQVYLRGKHYKTDKEIEPILRKSEQSPSLMSAYTMLRQKKVKTKEEFLEAIKKLPKYKKCIAILEDPEKSKKDKQIARNFMRKVDKLYPLLVKESHELDPYGEENWNDAYDINIGDRVICIISAYNHLTNKKGEVIDFAHVGGLIYFLIRFDEKIWNDEDAERVRVPDTVGAIAKDHAAWLEKDRIKKIDINEKFNSLEDYYDFIDKRREKNIEIDPYGEEEWSDEADKSFRFNDLNPSNRIKRLINYFIHTYSTSFKTKLKYILVPRILNENKNVILNLDKIFKYLDSLCYVKKGLIYHKKNGRETSIYRVIDHVYNFLYQILHRGNYEGSKYTMSYNCILEFWYLERTLDIPKDGETFLNMIRITGPPPKMYENTDNKEDIKIKVENKNYLVDDLIEKLSLVVKKRKIKSFRIKSIEGYINKSLFTKRGYVYETKLTVVLNNKDVLVGEYFSKNNNIVIKVNDEIIYDLDYKTFDNDVLVEKMISEYLKYLKEKKYLIKEQWADDTWDWDEDYFGKKEWKSWKDKYILKGSKWDIILIYDLLKYTESDEEKKERLTYFLKNRTIEFIEKWGDYFISRFITLHVAEIEYENGVITITDENGNMYEIDDKFHVKVLKEKTIIKKSLEKNKPPKEKIKWYKNGKFEKLEENIIGAKPGDKIICTVYSGPGGVGIVKEILPNDGMVIVEFPDMKNWYATMSSDSYQFLKEEEEDIKQIKWYKKGKLLDE